MGSCGQVSPETMQAARSAGYDVRIARMPVWITNPLTLGIMSCGYPQDSQERQEIATDNFSADVSLSEDVHFCTAFLSDAEAP